MKKLILLLSFLCCFAIVEAQNKAKVRRLNKNGALHVAANQFTGQDVDYYICNDNSTSEWTVFVDAEPMKGWQHDCYTVKVPKTITIPIDSVHPQITHLYEPPQGNYEPLQVSSRYPTIENFKPELSATNSINLDNSVANRTYALIISGGVNKLSNYERYWNDCSFIYQTLVKKYGIPKSHIYPIMSDGDNSGADMLGLDGTFKSQSLDLDFDGNPEISLAATKANITNTLASLENQMGQDDHLFIFVIDHGGTTTNNTNSYIWLWNYEKLYDYELANMLTPFSENLVNINVVLGQCYSGGFIDHLEKTGCVVAAASQGDEPSWACSDIPYDEFVYWWTCAVNGANHKGVQITDTIDTDLNGRTTMEEAFIFARDHDRRTEEHPQYISTPSSVGEDLAFNHLAPAVDLYIKDNPEDRGIEPNSTTDEFWKSPSIWLRNYDDSIEVHQNPEYTPSHQQAFIYVKVHNRGKKTFHGQGKWVIVYWAQASTAMNSAVWKGREVYNGRYATGGSLEAMPIDSIAPGESKTVRIRWSLPNLLSEEDVGENFHFCIFAKIMDTSFDDGYMEGKNYFHPHSLNDHAQKNITIIKKDDLSNAFNVYVRNVSSESKSYTLQLVARTDHDKQIFNQSIVELSMSDKVYTAWGRGGFQSNNIQILSDNSSNSLTPKRVRLKSPSSKLLSIDLNSNEFDIVNLKFNFIVVPKSSQTYTLDLIQRDEDGNIVGGETFVVETPEAGLIKPVGINKQQTDNGTYKLSVDQDDYNQVRWYDENGESMGTNNSILVSPKPVEKTYTVVALTGEGFASASSIDILPESGIKSIAKTSSNSIAVEFESGVPNNATITLVSTLNAANSSTYDIPFGAMTTSIDISALPKGIYAVKYTIGNEIIDQKKIML